MRKILINFAALLALTSMSLAVAAPSLTHPSAVDASGTFSIHGTPPQAFANIAVIEIGGNDEYGWKATPPFYGFVRLSNKAQTDYKLFKPTIDGNNISFKTRAVGGISYEFEGTFSSLDFAEKDMRNQVVLKGTLKKLAAGKVTAEAKLDFDYTPGG
ncbi:MAG TPA: hypothetical protein VE961_21920 [Pyrinomonadaceae bacterium]|nr:hypothetical protein [Pyrinomonadaceae bacterium]